MLRTSPHASMKLVAALVLSAAALAAPASALAAPVLAAPVPTAHVAQASGTPTPVQPLNFASDRAALNAYANYLNTIVKGFSSAQFNDTTYISTISGQCKSALAPLMQPNNQVNTAVQQTLTALGEEIGDDLSINFDQAALPAFLHLSATLSRLRWSHLSGGALIVKHYLNTESTVLQMAPSSLCENALLAASSPQIVPPNTKIFNRAYAKASNAANAALANLLKLMQTYQTYSERTLVTRIGNLAAQVTKLTKSNLLQSGSNLTSVLES